MAKETPPIDAEPSETHETPPKKKLPLVKYGIIAGILIAQIVIAYFVQKSVFFPSTATAHIEEQKSEEKNEEEASGETEVVMLDEIVVNPAETAGRRYLAVTIGLQLPGPEAEASIEKARPLIRDALISLLSSKKLDQLASISYRDTLRIEIKDAVNTHMKDKKVESVVFSGYVLQ